MRIGKWVKKENELSGPSSSSTLPETNKGQFRLKACVVEKKAITTVKVFEGRLEKILKVSIFGFV
jgi:hypothetical protein